MTATPSTARPRRFIARLAAVLGVVMVGGLGAPVLAASAAPTAPAAATSGCRAVGGGAVSSAGPSRATVVVDTGSGDVWAACISFSGTISGVQAIELAAAQIPDLNPVYDLYAGEGRAICQLRGVGNPPPDCLGKSVDYWGYFHNGRYSGSGAGRIQLSDGDVDGWRWGRDTTDKPGAPTHGAVATDAPPATTTTTTRPSSPPTTRPSGGGGGGGSGGGGISGTPGRPSDAPAGRPGSGGATTTTRPGTTTSTAPGATTTTTAADGSTSTTVGEDGADETVAKDGAGSDGGSGAASGRGGDGEQAAAPVVVADGRPNSGSALGSMLGFGVAVVLAVGIGLVLRQRRAATA